MLKLRGIVWGMVVVGVMGTVGVATGQEVATPGVLLPGRAAEKPVAPEFTLTVEFPGGTVGQYIDELKRAAGAHAVNVVTSRAAMDVQIAPISLRDVSVYAALSAVAGAAGQEAQWNVRGLGVGNTKTAEALALEYIAQPQPVRRDRTGAPISDSGIRVFSLRNLTEPMPGDPPGVRLTRSPEVVLTAVRAALDLAGDKGPAPEMKYHEDSGLLIIHGTNEQVGAVEQTIERVQADVTNRREAARQNLNPTVDVGAVQMQVRKSEIMLQQRQRELERAQTSLERGRKQADAGQMSAGELAQLEAKVDETKAQAELANLELERAHGELKEAEAARATGDGTPGAGPRAGESFDHRLDRLKQQLQETKDALSRNSEFRGALQHQGAGESDPNVQRNKAERAALEEQRDQVQAQLEAAIRAADLDGAGVPAGKAVVAYDLPPMDKAAREKLISAIMALEAAIGNPERLKLQSVQGDSKIVVEADGAMQAVVRGMVKEVASARGVKEPEKPKDNGKPKGSR